MKHTPRPGSFHLLLPVGVAEKIKEEEEYVRHKDRLKRLSENYAVLREKAEALNKCERELQTACDSAIHELGKLQDDFKCKLSAAKAEFAREIAKCMAVSC